MNYTVTWRLAGSKEGGKTGSILLSSNTSATLGREEGVDILLLDKSVSRLHGEIFVDDAGPHIVDRASANGVSVDGKRIAQKAPWRPGQVVTVGKFVLEIKSAAGAAESQLTLSTPTQLGRPDRPGLDNSFEIPQRRGRIRLTEVYDRARTNNKKAVSALFADFLGRGENIVDCGYLGAIGFMFPEHSFWCVTDTRVCSLILNRAGWVSFNFAFVKSLNRGVFIQPSLVLLWFWVLGWILAVSTLAIPFLQLGLSSFSENVSSAIVYVAIGIVIFTVGTLLMPWVVRAFYRWVKSGCIFWNKEHVPLVVPSDRNSLQNAQRFISVFTEQRQRLGT